MRVRCNDGKLLDARQEGRYGKVRMVSVQLENGKVP